jgi:hypothetical protein
MSNDKENINKVGLNRNGERVDLLSNNHAPLPCRLSAHPPPTPNDEKHFNTKRERETYEYLSHHLLDLARKEGKLTCMADID